MAAGESIEELCDGDLVATSYTYPQAKRLLHHFDVPFIRDMMRQQMTMDLLLLRKDTMQ